MWFQSIFVNRLSHKGAPGPAGELGELGVTGIMVSFYGFSTYLSLPSIISMKSCLSVFHGWIFISSSIL